MQNLTRGELQLKRGVQKNCQDCQKKFSKFPLVRQHQCKRCLKAICSECGNSRKEVYSLDFTKRDHRVCNNCKESSNYISNYIKRQNLKFGEMSDLGKKWLRKILEKPTAFGTDTSQHIFFTRQYFDELWRSYSFQFRELIGILTFKLQQEAVYNVVYEVYKTVISASKQSDIMQVILLIIFVLCFCAFDKAPFIVLYLLQIKDKSIDLKEITLKYIKALPFNELSRIETYINHRFQKHIHSLLINSLPMEIAINLITKILEKRNMEQPLMIFSTHLFVNREILQVRSSLSPAYLDNLMLRKCKSQELTLNFKYFKGKHFILFDQFSNQNNNLALRRIKTMNFDDRPQLYGKQFQSPNDPKIKLNLPIRDSIQYKNSQNFDDSFSLYLSPPNENDNSLKLSPSQPNLTQASNLELIPRPKKMVSQQDSPFRKNNAEQLSRIESSQAVKVFRKSTDINDIDVTNCLQCALHNNKNLQIQKKISSQRLKWNKQKQCIQAQNDTISEKLSKQVELNFSLKSRIKQLQNEKSIYQNAIKQWGSKLKQKDEQRLKNENAVEKMRQQLRKVNDKLTDERNDNIKLHVTLELQKRNVKQARQMCLTANRQNEQCERKLADHQKILTQFKEKQSLNNSCIQQNEENIKSLQQKIKILQKSNEKDLLISQSKKQAELSNIKFSNNQYALVIEQKDKQILGYKLKIDQLVLSVQSASRQLSQLQNHFKEKSIECAHFQQQFHNYREKQKQWIIQKIQLNQQLATKDQIESQHELQLRKLQLHTLMLQQQKAKLINKQIILQKQIFILQQGSKKQKLVIQAFQISKEDHKVRMKQQIKQQQCKQQQINSLLIEKDNLINDLKGKVQNIQIQLSKCENQRNALREELTKIQKFVCDLESQKQQLSSKLEKYQAIDINKDENTNNQEMQMLENQQKKRISREYQQKLLLELKQMHKSNKDLHQRLVNISELMMEIQEQKMELSDSLFNLRQFLRNRGISESDLT